jgi:UDP-glucose 4-epimerase
VEAVIHLASAGVSPQKASWEDLEKINIAASLRLIQLSHQAGVRRFIAAGTCHEYGLEGENWEHIPTAAPLKPITPYGSSKAAGFLMLQAFAIAHQMEFFYGRIFAAYGEGQFDGNLWPSLRRAASRGANFPMTDGKQVVDFVPVKDVAKHLAIATYRSDIIAGKPFVVNIGSGKGISILEFAKRYWIELGSSGTLEPGALPNRPNQLARMVADTDGLHYLRNLET